MTNQTEESLDKIKISNFKRDNVMNKMYFKLIRHNTGSLLHVLRVILKAY